MKRKGTRYGGNTVLPECQLRFWGKDNGIIVKQTKCFNIFGQAAEFLTKTLDVFIVFL